MYSQNELRHTHNMPKILALTILTFEYFITDLHDMKSSEAESMLTKLRN